MKQNFNSIYGENNELLEGKEALNYPYVNFSTVGDRINIKLLNYPIPFEPNSGTEPTVFDQDPSCLSPHDVKNAVKDLSVRKSSGKAEIKTELLRHIF